MPVLTLVSKEKDPSIMEELQQQLKEIENINGIEGFILIVKSSDDDGVSTHYFTSKFSKAELLGTLELVKFTSL